MKDLSMSASAVGSYSDSFDSTSLQASDLTSDATSLEPFEDNYTSDTFSSIDSVSEKSIKCDARAGNFNVSSHSSVQSDKNNYEDTFESTSKEYSSNLSDNKINTEDSLKSPNGNQQQFQATFINSLVKNIQKISKKGEKIENKKKTESNSQTLPEEIEEFCNRKLNTLRNVKGQEENHKGTVHNAKTEERNKSTTMPITKRRLEQMKIENIHHRMKRRLNEIDVHDIKTCPACIAAQEEIAEKQFISSRSAYLQSKLIDEKIQHHLKYKNSIGLIGEMAASLPKPSDPPQEIWSLLIGKSYQTETSKQFKVTAAEIETSENTCKK